MLATVSQACDKRCNVSWLGNFWELDKDTGAMAAAVTATLTAFSQLVLFDFQATLLHHKNLQYLPLAKNLVTGRTSSS